MLPPAPPDSEDILVRYHMLFSWLKAKFNIPTANDPARWQQDFLRIAQSIRQKLATLPEMEEISPQELDYCAFYLTLLKQKQDISRFQFERKVQCSIHTSLYSLLGRQDAANLIDLPAWKDEPTFIINIMRKQDFAQPLSHFETEYPFPIQLPPVPPAKLTPYPEIDTHISPILQELLGEVILNRPLQEKVLHVFHEIFGFIQEHQIKKLYSDRVLIGILIFSIRIVVGHNMDAIFPSIRHVLRIYNRLHPRTIIPLSYRFTESRRLIDAYHKFKEDTRLSPSSKSAFATQVTTKSTPLNSTQMDYTSSIQYGIVPLPFELFRVMEAYNDPYAEFLNFLVKVSGLETNLQCSNMFNKGIQFDSSPLKVDVRKQILSLFFGEDWYVYSSIVKRFYPLVIKKLSETKPEWLDEYDSLEISAILFMVAKTIQPWDKKDNKPLMRLSGSFNRLNLNTLPQYFPSLNIDKMAQFISDHFYAHIIRNSFFQDPEKYEISPQTDCLIFRNNILMDLTLTTFNKNSEIKGKSLSGIVPICYKYLQPLDQTFQDSLIASMNIVSFRQDLVKNFPPITTLSSRLDTIDAPIILMVETYRQIMDMKLPFSAVNIAEVMNRSDFIDFVYDKNQKENKKKEIWVKITQCSPISLYDLDFLELSPVILEECLTYCHEIKTEVAIELIDYFPKRVMTTIARDSPEFTQGRFDPQSLLQYFLQCETPTNRNHNLINIEYHKYLNPITNDFLTLDTSLNIWFALELFQAVQTYLSEDQLEDFHPDQIILVCYLLVQYRHISTHIMRESIERTMVGLITPKNILKYVPLDKFTRLMELISPICRSHYFPQLGRMSFTPTQNEIVNSCLLNSLFNFICWNCTDDIELMNFADKFGIKETTRLPKYLLPLFPRFEQFLDSESAAEAYFSEIYTCIRYFDIPFDGLFMKDSTLSISFVYNSYHNFSPITTPFPLLPPLINNMYPERIEEDDIDPNIDFGDLKSNPSIKIDIFNSSLQHLNELWRNPPQVIINQMIKKIYNRPFSNPIFCHHERNLIKFCPELIAPLIEEFKIEIRSILQHQPRIHEDNPQNWSIYFQKLIEILQQAKDHQCSLTPDQQIAENPFLDRILKLSVVNDRLDELDKRNSGWQQYAPLLYAIAVHYGIDQEDKITYTEIKALTRPYLSSEFIAKISRSDPSDFRQLLQVVSEYQSEEFNAFLIQNLPPPTAVKAAHTRMSNIAKEMFLIANNLEKSSVENPMISQKVNEYFCCLKSNHQPSSDLPSKSFQNPGDLNL